MKKQYVINSKRLLGLSVVSLMVACGGDDNFEEAELDVNIPIPEIAAATNKINDTGIVICKDDLASEDCLGGRDADTTLSKIGAGNAGFDFTKLDAQGITLAETVTDWACVKDNHTGLIWEVKTNRTLHNNTDKYSWYSDDFNHTGEKGLADTTECFNYVQEDAESYCNTEAFVARVNAENFCGANNWRLPTRAELIGLVDYGRSQSPAIDSHYFPQALGDNYWTSSPSVRGVNQIWSVNFTQGSSSDTPDAITEDINNALTSKYVRLVRG